MAEKNNKGKIGDYNSIPVKQKEYYYDREETDKDIQKEFGDMLSDLKGMNKKFKKEAEKEVTPKLNIDMSEGLLSKAQIFNDTEKAKREFDNYKKAGGTCKNLESFLKKAISLVQAGKEVKTGRDVAQLENNKSSKRDYSE
jgi:hypothetical protein